MRTIACQFFRMAQHGTVFGHGTLVLVSGPTQEVDQELVVMRLRRTMWDV
jgi:hypothetical protein